MDYISQFFSDPYMWVPSLLVFIPFFGLIMLVLPSSKPSAKGRRITGLVLILLSAGYMLISFNFAKNFQEPKIVFRDVEIYSLTEQKPFNISDEKYYFLAKQKINGEFSYFDIRKVYNFDIEIADDGIAHVEIWSKQYEPSFWLIPGGLDQWFQVTMFLPKEHYIENTWKSAQ